MPHLFSFDASSIPAAGTLERADFSKGTYPGLDYPNQWSAVAPNQSIATSGGVDVFALTMVAGQTYTFDIDSGQLDLELDIISQTGLRVGGSDNGTGDPLTSFTASQTGTYFIAIHHATNDYINGSFQFEGTPGPTGAYQLNVSTADLAGTRYTYGATNDSFSFAPNQNTTQIVRSGAGNDTLLLNGGNDIGVGGDGNDSLYGGSGQDELSGAAGSDRLYGGSGDDVVRGGSSADLLYGGSERDALSGGSGNDGLYGGTGSDILWGEAGNDTIRGEGGNDFIRGGDGLDLLYGGAGADTFHFLRGEAPPSTSSVEDRIQDFEDGDRIDLTDLVFGTLTWRGSGAFTAAYQVRVVELTNGYTDVRVNLDNDAASEFEVLVKTVGGFDLIASDFLL